MASRDGSDSPDTARERQLDPELLARLFADAVTPLVRTEFSDDRAWGIVVQRLTRAVNFDDLGAEADPDEDYVPNVEVIEDPAHTGLDPGRLATLVPLDRPGYGYVLLADARSMSEARDGSEITVQYVDLSWDPEYDDTPPGRSFRVVDTEFALIEANLAIANMGFDDYLDAVTPDGVFRGFGSGEAQGAWRSQP